MNFFSSWEDLLRIAIVGSCAYLSLVLLLRGFGKRTLSKLNAFDFVVTIALGSILASTILDTSVTLADGVVALIVLMTWQLAFTWLASRFSRVREVLASEPRLLAHDGMFIESAMRSERVANEEVLQAVRMHGSRGLADVRSVLLEADGSLSVIALSE